MAKVENLRFPALRITGDNYLTWITNVEDHLESDGLLETIQEINASSSQDKAKAKIFIKRHLDENLFHDYSDIKDPAELWKALKERFDNQRAITLPHALDQWANLRFQDFEKVSEYNSVMLRLVTRLQHCGKPVTDAEMLDKTYLTFHKSHYVLQEQYRNRNYKKFSELMVALLIAETNSELLVKNHNTRPAGSKAPEVNAAVTKYPVRESQMNRGRGRRFNRGRGRSYNPQGMRHTVRKDDFPIRKEPRKNFAPKRETTCYKCGSKGHWFKVCRTPEHLCKLYKESMKGKEKEVNHLEQLETHLHGSDFASCSDDVVPMED